MTVIFYFYLWLPVEISVAAHDTTGGMVTKISEAAMIAKLGIEVYIVKVDLLCFVIGQIPSNVI